MFHKQGEYGIREFVANMCEFDCVLILMRGPVHIEGPVIYYQPFLRANCGLGLYCELHVCLFI